MLDVIFISYRESNAEENWRHLLSLVPSARRVHGVEGISRAHRAAAAKSVSKFFFLVDGDNFVLPEFKFALPKEPLQEDSVYVWRARNPVNDLVYGFGGVKIYPKSLFEKEENLRMGRGDLATSAGKHYVVVEEIASETRFNATPLEAWRGAFREAAKLTVNLHQGAGDSRTRERLQTWLTRGQERLHGEWVLKGARAGREFGVRVQEGRESLSKINDFQWLEQRFNTP
jgi:hypothetical protein